MKNVLKVFTLFVCLFFIGSKAFAQNPSSLVLRYTVPPLTVYFRTDVTVTYDQTTALPGQPTTTISGIQRTVSFLNPGSITVATASSGYTQYKVTSMTFSARTGNQANTTFFNTVNNNIGAEQTTPLNSGVVHVTNNYNDFFTGAQYTFEF